MLCCHLGTLKKNKSNNFLPPSIDSERIRRCLIISRWSSSSCSEAIFELVLVPIQHKSRMLPNSCRLSEFRHSKTRFHFYGDFNLFAWLVWLNLLFLFLPPPPNSGIEQYSIEWSKRNHNLLLCAQTVITILTLEITHRTFELGLFSGEIIMLSSNWWLVVAIECRWKSMLNSLKTSLRCRTG